MALDPKWSEEARKNVKETSIDERMYERMAEQKKLLEKDKLSQKPQTPTPTPSIPVYPGSIRQTSTAVATDISSTKAPAFDDETVNEAYERIMERIGTIVREELHKLIKE